MSGARTDAYGAAFYAGQIEGSARAAHVVLPLVYGIFVPTSVIDIGCGQGAWLAAAEALGSRTLTGLDGEWVDRTALRSCAIDFRPTDLGGEIAVERRHDLCISVEVAEHLPAARADAFVAALCRAADVVLFSAAVPYQGGTEHLNEERASRWVARFDAAGYACFDVLRGAVWDDPRVAWWYRQNLLLFVARASPLFPRFTAVPQPPTPRDLVHPEAFEEKLRYLLGERERLRSWLERPTLTQAARAVGRAVRKFFSR